MFKLFAALAAAISLSFAAAALPTSSSASDDTLTLKARLSGVQGRGSAVYLERPGTSKVTQLLSVQISGAEPNVSYKVVVNGVGIGAVTTDKDGYAAGRFSNPPMYIPRVRAGSVIMVGPYGGRFQTN